MFAESSRYHGLRDLEHRDARGRVHLYKERRFLRDVPVADRGTTISSADRLDTVASRELSRGELFWLLCDVNRVLDPFELHGASGRPLALPRR